MPDITPDPSSMNLTTSQLLVRNYGVPMLFILTGVGIGWYLTKKRVG